MALRYGAIDEVTIVCNKEYLGDDVYGRRTPHGVRGLK